MSSAFVLESRNRPSMLVQVHEASCVLNDRLEEIRRSSFKLPAFPKPADTPKTSVTYHLASSRSCFILSLSRLGFGQLTVDASSP